MQFVKKGFIFAKDKPNSWWHSHTMAPSAIYWQGRIRVFMGCWDEKGISRIGYVDLNPENPSEILAVSDKPVLDIGADGCFDENGVFPAHANVIDGKIYLYYTGFQLGHKIPHYNFNGLAVSEDGIHYKRVTQAPILDRADEGLFVRAGVSVIQTREKFSAVYSAGSSFVTAGGKLRPTYDVYYQEIINPQTFAKAGKKILSADQAIEHGLGRPQIIKIDNKLCVFYTRRLLNMKYFFGYAQFDEVLGRWSKQDNSITPCHSEQGFDSEMIYFPSVVYVPDSKKYLLFYCGNGFGKTGFGYFEIIS